MAAKRKPKRWPGIGACRRHAESTLAAAPAHAHIERVEPVGQLVAEFVLPLEYAPTSNRYAEKSRWALAAVKKACLRSMQSQRALWTHAGVLTGRPHVHAIRFSAVAPDATSDWSKVPVDRLTAKHGGIGIIKDDNPAAARICTWWEPAPPGAGFVLLRVYTGESRDDCKGGS